MNFIGIYIISSEALHDFLLFGLFWQIFSFYPQPPHSSTFFHSFIDYSPIHLLFHLYISIYWFKSVDIDLKINYSYCQAQSKRQTYKNIR